MRKSAGFTLIELVIVIVILGILGAVAAPKFLNLQGDAYSANVKSLAGSLQSATTLANTKAVLEGKDTGTNQDVDGYTSVKFDYGFPQAKDDEKGILGTLQTVPADGEDYEIALDTDSSPNTVTLQPKARAAASDAAISSATECFVRYTAAKAPVAASGNDPAEPGEPAKIEFDADCE